MSYSDDVLELQLVRSQVQRILQTGSVVSADGRTLTHVNLPDLRAHQGWLEERIANARQSVSGNQRRGRGRSIDVVPRV